MNRAFRTIGLRLTGRIVFALIFIASPALCAQDDQLRGKPNLVEGAWKLIDDKNGKLSDNIEMLKYVTSGRFVWTMVKDGRVVGALGGKYVTGDGTYTETVDYALDDAHSVFLGKSAEFVSHVDRRIWHVVGTIKVNGQDLAIDQKWERCKE